MKKYGLPIILVLLLIVVFYVWPGFWRYKYDGIDLRIDRLTQHVYTYDSKSSTWVPF